MFSLAILICVYAYILFGMGIVGLLSRVSVLLVTICYWGFLLLWRKNEVISLLRVKMLRKALVSIRSDRFSSLLLFLIILMALVNLIGVFGPEIGFDALWYHLTLPKLYLQWGSIKHISGGLLYYSDMPKLVEMLYMGGLSFFHETGAKLIHFLFGGLTTVITYKLARELISRKYALIAAVVFYANLVVGWESTSAYIDLGRSFFEVLALYAFSNWIKTDKKQWFIESAVMLGLAISTKVLAASSLLIFIILIVFGSKKKRSIRERGELVAIYVLMALLIPLPWFIFSFLNTGSFFYPFFTQVYPVEVGAIVASPLIAIKDLFTLFTKSADPINPLYIFTLPLFFLVRKMIDKRSALIFFYSILALFVWSLLPKTGGGRFIIPYLPALSIACAIVIATLSSSKSILYKKIGFLLLVTSMVILVSSIGYRALANAKYIPVILGRETKAAFLAKHLNFSFGDFYDVDGYFKNKLTKHDRVLLYGFHNLYYVDFPFIDSSYVKKGDRFNYIAVQGGVIPERFNYWNELYYNKTTHVRLYSLGGQMWMY